MFKPGDAIVHPARGAGIVTGVKERQFRGGSRLYYSIALLDGMGTHVMVPTDVAETLGLRRAIRQSGLKQVWRVLVGDSESLPTEYKDRRKLLEDKLGSGDTLQVAEMVRDMAWRRWRRGKVTAAGRRLYDKGVMLLAGEIAAVRGIELASAELEVQARLRESLSAGVAN